MNVIESTTVLWKDLRLVHDAVNNGGIIVTGKFGLKITKFGGGLYLQTVLLDTGTPLKDSVYYEKVTNYKKPKQEAEKEEIILFDKKEESKTNDASDLFNLEG